MQMKRSVPRPSSIHSSSPQFTMRSDVSSVRAPVSRRDHSPSTNSRSSTPLSPAKKVIEAGSGEKTLFNIFVIITCVLFPFALNNLIILLIFAVTLGLSIFYYMQVSKSAETQVQQLIKKHSAVEIKTMMRDKNCVIDTHVSSRLRRTLSQQTFNK